MKKILFLFLIMVLLSACTTLKMETESGIKVEYKRSFSGLKMSSMKVTPEEDGRVTIEIEGLESDVAEAMNVINNVLDKIK